MALVSAETDSFSFSGFMSLVLDLRTVSDRATMSETRVLAPIILF